MVNATEQAWRWIDRLGVPGPNPAEPLPPYVYVLAAHVAASPERRPARVRVRATVPGSSSGPRRLPPVSGPGRLRRHPGGRPSR